MGNRIVGLARAGFAPVLLALAGVASAAPAEDAEPETEWLDAFPFADEIDARAIAGLGAGVRVRGWTRAAYPGLGTHGEASGGGGAGRYLHFFDAPDHAPFRFGLTAEIAGLATHGRTDDSVCLGACASSVSYEPGYYRFESDQRWLFGGGAVRLVKPSSCVHLQLDGGVGLVWLRTSTQLVWGPTATGGPPPPPTVDRRGVSDGTLAAARAGLELGVRLSRRNPPGVGAPFHVGFRLRLDAWETLGRSRLRLDGDAQESATLSPALISLSLGLVCAF